MTCAPVASTGLPCWFPDHWAVIASLIETAKLNDVDPQAWLTDTLTRLAAGHPSTDLDALMPWHHACGVA